MRGLDDRNTFHFALFLCFPRLLLGEWKNTFCESRTRKFQLRFFPVGKASLLWRQYKSVHKWKHHNPWGLYRSLWSQYPYSKCRNHRPLRCNQLSKSIFEHIPSLHMLITFHPLMTSIFPYWGFNLGIKGNICKFFMRCF